MNHRVSRLLIFTVVVAGIASAQTASEAERLQNRVSELEKKVALLEAALQQFTQLKTTPPPQEIAAATPPPAPILPADPPQREPFQTPPELIPEIGKIGAQVGLILSGSGNPFHLDNGTYAAGFIDLPLVDRPKWLHGKISYEILVGMSQSKTTFKTTSNVAQVANLAVLSALNPNGGLDNINAAVTGTGPAPFPVTNSTVTKLRLLEVIPFSLKYTTTALERWRLRPYATLGFGTYVTIHSQYPVPGTASSYGVRSDAQLPPEVLAAVKQIFGGQAPFGGPLVAGQLSQSPELEARGLPGGHGNIDFGIQGAIGFEYRLTKTLSLGFDNRYNRIAGAPGLLVTYGTRIGVHF